MRKLFKNRPMTRGRVGRPPSECRPSCLNPQAGAWDLPRPETAPPDQAAERWLFSPGIWWIGSRMNRSGSEVHVLRMYSLGVRPFSVLSLRAKLSITRKSAMCLRRWPRPFGERAKAARRPGRARPTSRAREPRNRRSCRNRQSQTATGPAVRRRRGPRRSGRPDDATACSASAQAPRRSRSGACPAGQSASAAGRQPVDPDGRAWQRHGPRASAP